MSRDRRDVVVLAGSLALATPAAARGEEPAPAPAPPVEKPAAVVEAGPRVHPAVRASAGADFASLPALAPGADFALLVLFGANRVEIRGSAWVPQPATATSMPGAGGQISLLAAGLRYCRAFVQRTLELGGCGGLEAGALLARGYGVTMPVSGGGPWVAPGLGLLGLWNISPSFSLALALDGLVPVLRERFVLAGLGEIYRPPPVTGRALLGLEARLW
jgi:hypothetical protein